MTLRRRLVAALAAAGLVLGGALVAVPAAAEIVGPGTPVFEITVDGEVHVQPGDSVFFFPSITRVGELDPDLAPASQIALKVTFPDTLEFVNGSCDAFVDADDIVHFPPYKGAQDPTYTFASGDECVVSGGLGDSVSAGGYIEFLSRAEEFFSAEPPLEELPHPRASCSRSSGPSCRTAIRPSRRKAVWETAAPKRPAQWSSTLPIWPG